MGNAEAMKRPSFNLPPCPVCSNLGSIYRPSWRLARHTTAKRGHECYMLVGCCHVDEVAPVTTIHDTAEEWDVVEQVWSYRAKVLLEQRIGTPGWTEEAKETFRHTLAEKALIPAGLTIQLPLEAPTTNHSTHPEDEEPQF